MERLVEASPRLAARIAGVFYLLTFVTGTSALLFVRGRLVASLIATASYIVVTVLFYGLFKPVNRSLSLAAASVGLAGCAFGALSALRLAPFRVSPLAFFGCYCLLIGYLAFRSTFLPPTLGGLMAIGGLGWLTFLSPSLARLLSPYNMAPGIIGEASLTVWLLVFGIDAGRWNELARLASRTPPSQGRRIQDSPTTGSIR